VEARSYPDMNAPRLLHRLLSRLFRACRQASQNPQNADHSGNSEDSEDSEEASCIREHEPPLVPNNCPCNAARPHPATRLLYNRANHPGS
jgi:hypothetical protein